MPKHDVWLEFNRSAACEKAKQHLEMRLAMLYFCGYRLDRVFENDLFRKLTDYAEIGFCYELSALAMFLLEDHPMSKMVHGIATLDEESGHHAIAEFSLGGEDFVLDLAWFGPQPIPYEIYRKTTNFRDVDFQTGYNTFWDDSPTRLIYQYMKTPELSHLFCELAYYRPSGPEKAMIAFKHDLFGAGSMIEHLSQVGVGYKLLPRVTTYGKVIDQKLIDQFMAEGPIKAESVANS